MAISRWRLLLTGGAVVLLVTLVVGLAQAAGPRAADASREGVARQAGTDGTLPAGLLEEPDDDDDGDDEHRRGAGILRRLGRGLDRLVHAEALVDVPERGLTTFAADRGKVTAIDGSKVRITQAGGRAAEFTTDDETRLRKGGERSPLSALAVGDEVLVFSVREAGAQAFEARRIVVRNEDGDG